MRRYERTRALVEGDPLLASSIVREVEEEMGAHAVTVLDEPREELVMVKVRETAKGSLFFLGEALATSCRVRIGDAVGIGLVLGNNRCLAYELAVVDAAFSGEAGAERACRWDERLRAELDAVAAREAEEVARANKTRVDFSTMEVEL